MHPSPVCPQPGYRQTRLSAGRLPPASASTELVRGFPGCPWGRHRCGKKHEVIFDFYGPLSPIKMLKAVTVIIRSSFVLTRVQP